MRFAKIAVALLLSFPLVGCSDGLNENPVDVAAPSATENMRTVLQGIADTGEMNSGAQSVQTDIQQLKETDPAKADKLQALYDQLMSSGGNKAKLKSTAKEMLSTL